VGGVPGTLSLDPAPPPPPSSAQQAGVTLISMADMVPVSLAVYDMKTFTFLLLLSAPLSQVCNSNDQKEFTG